MCPQIIVPFPETPGMVDLHMHLLPPDGPDAVWLPGQPVLVAPGGAVTPHPGAPRVLARPDPGPPSGEAREEVIGGPVGDGHQLAALRSARPVSRAPEHVLGEKSVATSSAAKICPPPTTRFC